MPWHVKNYDSHNWLNDICNRLELGPVISGIQANCFKPLSFTDPVLADMKVAETGIVMDDFSTLAMTSPNHVNSEHSHDLARFRDFVCKLWPPDSFDQVTEAAGQTQPKIELAMAYQSHVSRQ